jgi:hypothetical protein
MTAPKVYTVRLTAEQARRVEFVARATELSVNDLFRAALETHFAQLRQDPQFMARVDEVLAQDAAIAKELV